jgi:hypothetical protein
MQCHPQPHSLRQATPRIVRTDRSGKPDRKVSRQKGFRYLRRNQDERTVTTVLTRTPAPVHPALGKCLRQRLIQRLADRELIQAGPSRITEPFHVNNNDRAVNS